MLTIKGTFWANQNFTFQTVINYLFVLMNIAVKFSCRHIVDYVVGRTNISAVFWKFWIFRLHCSSLSVIVRCWRGKFVYDVRILLGRGLILIGLWLIVWLLAELVHIRLLFFNTVLVSYQVQIYLPFLWWWSFPIYSIRLHLKLTINVVYLIIKFTILLWLYSFDWRLICLSMHS